MTLPEIQNEERDRERNKLAIAPSRLSKIAEYWSKSPLRNWHPAWIVFLLLTITGCGIAAHKSGLLDRLFEPSPISPTERDGSQCNSPEYPMLRSAETLGDVRDIMDDRGREIETNGGTSTYVWKVNGDKIVVTFVDGKVARYSRSCD